MLTPRNQCLVTVVFGNKMIVVGGKTDKVEIGTVIQEKGYHFEERHPEKMIQELQEEKQHLQQELDKVLQQQIVIMTQKGNLTLFNCNPEHL